MFPSSTSTRSGNSQRTPDDRMSFLPCLPGVQVRELRTQGTSDGVDVVDAWYEVLRDLSLLPISDVVRQAYEEVLATFPTAVRPRFLMVA